MNAPLRRGIRPPQPIDVNSPQWLAMFYQWVIDTLTNLDECLDKTQEAHEETRTEISVWMTSAKNFDEDFNSRLRDHIDAHLEIDRVQKAKRSVWFLQWNAFKDAARFASSGAVTAIVVVVLKWLGAI